jgi:hypothetical protein
VKKALKFCADEEARSVELPVYGAVPVIVHFNIQLNPSVSSTDIKLVKEIKS